MVNRKRNAAITVRVTQREKEFIFEKYRRSKEKTFTDFFIKSILFGKIFVINTEELVNVSYEINKIGTNINQIAHRVNSTGNIYETDIKEIEDKLLYLKNFVKKYYDILEKIKEVQS